MGMLVDGKWSTEWYTPDKEGRFVRADSSFRGRVSADGSTGFAAEPGRYHLYVSFACPWGQRALIMRRLKGLEAVVTLSVVDPYMGPDGWAFSDSAGSIPDTVNKTGFLRDIYIKAEPSYTGRVTVPVLWDRATSTIVNNRSLDIMRIFDTEFDSFTDPGITFYPEGLRAEIDETIEAIYNPINNGVYRAGFATTQGAYDEAVGELFAAPRPLGRAAFDPPLLDRRAPDRGRLVPLYHPGTLRYRLLYALQVQSEAYIRVPESLGLLKGAVPGAWRLRDLRFWPHKEPLLYQPSERQPPRANPRWAAYRPRFAPRQGLISPYHFRGCRQYQI